MNIRPGRGGRVESGTALLCAIITLVFGFGVALLAGSLMAGLGAGAAICLAMMVALPSLPTSNVVHHR
ncbi:hypothetical protein [Nocardia aurea]|uniref:Uncharacterized protein n=2 Tax=Nocardiaceae TaxID=85025 RepID=A0ABV3FXS3_9NOCA